MADNTTPPADDVREALAEVQWYVHGGVGRRDHWEWLGHSGADAVMRKFKVRPRGTVTDAEVERAMSVFLKHPGKGTAAAMRAALEDAWGGA